MTRRVSLVDDPPAFRQIAEHHNLVEDGICLYYSRHNPQFEKLFLFDTEEEVRAKRDATLREAREASAMTLLASIEASFRVDYLQRNYAKKKDCLSRAFCALYKEKQEKVSLTDDILQCWKEHSDVTAQLVGDIRRVFKYRNWLAHGRYWVPKLGRQYDFETLYDLGRSIETAFPFLRS